MRSDTDAFLNTTALLATIAELTAALAAETKLADRNAAMAAKYKQALENIQLWINEGLSKR